MILDQALFDRLSPQSAQRVPVRCDSCGRDRTVIKQNLVRAKNHDCQVCTAKRIGHACKGIVRSEEHRKRTALASRGRKWPPETRARMAGTRSGAFSPTWNPDRDAVRRKELARRAAYGLLQATLRRVGKPKDGLARDIVGYTSSRLAAHLEAQFEPGMSWAERSKWHIDHIKPVAAFVAEGVTDPAVINALSNLRPLWARDNLVKNDQWTAL